jgi:hypothetical protein
MAKTSKKSAKKSTKTAAKSAKAVAPVSTLVRETELVSEPGEEPEVTVETFEFSTDAEPELAAKKSVAKKSTKSAKAVAKKAAAPVAPVSKKVRNQIIQAKAPNPLHQKLIALMARKDGATISDFQTVEGFNIPSMAALRIAERHGYTASSSKKPGEKTVYKAVKRA